MKEEDRYKTGKLSDTEDVGGSEYRGAESNGGQTGTTTLLGDTPKSPRRENAQAERRRDPRIIVAGLVLTIVLAGITLKDRVLPQSQAEPLPSIYGTCALSVVKASESAGWVHTAEGDSATTATDIVAARVPVSDNNKRSGNPKAFPAQLNQAYKRAPGSEVVQLANGCDPDGAEKLINATNNPTDTNGGNEVLGLIDQALSR